MNIHSYLLDNGLKIHIKPDFRTPVVLSQIWYKVGSTYEPKGLTGISHMLEHMMFKGTNEYTKEQINNLIENNGGIQNAFTSFDYTAYYQFWHKKNLELSLSLESSRMSNLLFNDNEFKLEKKVVLEERNLRVEDQALSYAFEQFMQLAYKNNPRHTPIIGWQKDIENYTLTHIKDWYKQHYSPNNASIVIAGDVNSYDTYRMIKEHFDFIAPSKILETKQKPSLINTGHRHIKIQKPPNNNSAIIMGYVTPSLTDDYRDNDPFALMILNSILGSADGSILQQKLTRDENLCCNIDSEYSPFIRDEDMFIITAIANHDQNIENIQSMIENIIKNLKETGITETQLNRAKIVIKSDKIFSMDSLETQANIIGSLASIDLDINYYKYIDKLYDVTLNDIYRVLNRYFARTNLTSLHLLKD